MDRMRIWPHGVLIIVGCAIIGAGAALLWSRYERSAEAKALPNVARIERVDGQVGLNRSLDNQANTQWIQATPNTPVSVGDRIYTRDNSRTEVAFTGRNFATVDANTSLDVLDLSNQRTQVALRDGSALFDVGSIASGDLFEVATPCGAVDLQQPGLYQIGIDNNGNASATALSGRAQLIGQSGSSTIEKGETLSLQCQGRSQAALTRVDGNQAGALVDNYYRYRYPRKYDGRYRNYYTYLDDPNYYDPSRSYNSYNYVSDYVPGVDDLDDYGDWQYVTNYGYCWHPRVDTAWAPYQSGSWTMDYPYGLTWVSNEPWGYAPYHYGRWAYSSNEWFWVPEPARTYPAYSPALVAFIPLGQSSAGWVALGPGDPYAPRYYDSNWQPVYLSRTNVIQERIVNINVPGALTVVPAQDFTRVIDRTMITRVDPQTITRVRPVLDPLKVDPLRRAAFETRAAQRRIDMPQVVAQRISNTPVVTSSAPVAPPFRRDLAQALRVQQVGDRAKENKLQLRDNRAASAQQIGANSAPVGSQAPGQQGQLAIEQGREKQMADLSRQAARGDRNARQQMHELQRQQVEQQRAERVTAQQAQGERVRQQMQQQNVLRQQQQTQREAARQQMITNQQQRHAAAQPQIQMRQQQRQTEVHRAQQQVIRHSEQQQPVRSQPQTERRKPPVQDRQPQTQRPLTVPQQQVRPPQAQPARAAVRVRPPQPQAQSHPQPQVERQQKPASRPQPAGQKKKPPEKR